MLESHKSTPEMTREAPNADEGTTKLETQASSRKIYGLIIGIDTYVMPPVKSAESSEPPASPGSPKSVESMDFEAPRGYLKPLSGAVNDAKAVAEFLQSLGPSQIVQLWNEKATRKRIIDEIRALSNNQDINKDDPILIYYAGHGGYAAANARWTAKYDSKRIQVIFPCDYHEPEEPDSTKRVNCIPDKTMAKLLNELSLKKGDNITLIFDSCFSASANRSNFHPPTPERLERWEDVDPDMDIPPEIDDDLFPADGLSEQQRGAELLPYDGQTSHVFLAACGSNETAGEVAGRGLFTVELLKNLPIHRVNQITYYDLIKSLKISDQSPICHGKHKFRILFKTYVTRDPSFIDVNLDDTNSLILNVGAVSGVTLKSIWDLHRAPKEDSELLGRFKVVSVHDTTSVLEPLDSQEVAQAIDGGRLFARCVQFGLDDDQSLKVWMPPDVLAIMFPNTPHYMGNTHTTGMSYKMTETRDTADVVVEIHYPAQDLNPVAVFYWYDDSSRRYGTKEVPYRSPAVRDKVEKVLFAIARWKWHLLRVNPATDGIVTISTLKVATRKDLYSPRIPLKENEVVPTREDGVIDIEESSPASLYGFKLRSTTASLIYTKVFYFDTTDFSIVDMSQNPVGPGAIDADITSRGELLIGNGGDGGAPIRLTTSKNPMELGYMKIFWSARPLELQELPQGSSFEGKEPRGASRDPPSPGEWGTACVTVVIRKQGVPSAQI